MIRALLIGLSVFALLTTAATDDTKEPGFAPLFTGKDLAGWKLYASKRTDTWGAEDGLLFTKSGGGGWLMTEKEYGDFELRFEFKMPKMGNSGVAIRSPLEGDPAYTGMEIQLLDDENWKGLKPTQYCGSIYDVVPASKHVMKPAGEWNKMRVVAQGRKIVIELNGTEIVNANLDDHKDRAKPNPEKNQNAHPGLLRAKGHIGFQSYNFRVDFRDIQLMPLGDKGEK